VGDGGTLICCCIICLPLAQDAHVLALLPCSHDAQLHGHDAQESVDAIEAASSLLLSSLDAEMSTDSDEDGKKQGSPLLAVGFVLGGIFVLLGGGYLLRGQIQSFLDFFINAIDEWGNWGYFAYALCYTTLEVLAIPAIPLTMTAGEGGSGQNRFMNALPVHIAGGKLILPVKNLHVFLCLSGAIFGPTVGTVIVCLSGTLAATISFLISRYLARDQVCAI